MFVALAEAGRGPDEASCRDAGIDLVLLGPTQPVQIIAFLGRLRSVLDDFESFDPGI
jgi:hypothetical protein